MEGPTPETTEEKTQIPRSSERSAKAHALDGFPRVERLSTVVTTPEGTRKKVVRKKVMVRRRGEGNSGKNVLVLQKQLNEQSITHAEEMYWIQLELETTKKSKQAVEDGMAELYRDLQSMKDETGNDDSPRKANSTTRRQRPVILTASYVNELHSQLDKYERMFQILNNQISLVRTSSDGVVKSLKDELKRLMEQKTKNETEAANQYAELDQKLQLLQNTMLEQQKLKGKKKLGIQPLPPSGSDSPRKKTAEKVKKLPSIEKPLAKAITPRRASTSAIGLPRQAEATSTTVCTAATVTSRSSHTSCSDDPINVRVVVPMDKENLQQEVDKLKEVNAKLTKDLQTERNHSRDSHTLWKREREGLNKQIDQLQAQIGEIQLSTREEDDCEVIVTSTAERTEEDVVGALERTALIWKRADESVHNLSGVIRELQGQCCIQPSTSDENDDTIEARMSKEPLNEQEQLLSTLETASLVQGQVKVSLMFVETKLRNLLTKIKNETVEEVSNSELCEELQASFDKRIQEVQQQALVAIEKLESALNRQVKKLGDQSEREAQVVKTTFENKISQMADMKRRQNQLEGDIKQMDKEADQETEAEMVSKETVIDDKIYLSRSVLDRLQSEVLQVVQQVKEKDEQIGHLTATVEEHKVRERTLMDELKRHMREQAERQMVEQQRLIAKMRLEDDSDSDGSILSGEESSAYEETTLAEGESYIEETVAEETVYDSA